MQPETLVGYVEKYLGEAFVRFVGGGGAPRDAAQPPAPADRHAHRGCGQPCSVQTLADCPRIALAHRHELQHSAHSGTVLLHVLRHTSRCAGIHGWSCVDQLHRVLLCVPAELCQQVLAVVRGLAKGAPLRSAALTGGRPWRTQREALDQASRCGSWPLFLDRCRQSWKALMPFNCGVCVL